MTYIEPDFIYDAWKEIQPYLVEDSDHHVSVREDAPYYIKDAYMALKRRDKWITEIRIFGDYQHRLDDL